MIAWPFAKSRREDEGMNKGWGLAAAGARRGAGPDVADQIYAGEGFDARFYYLNLNGRWCRVGQTTPTTNLIFQAGQAIYYLNSGTNFTWIAKEE